MAFWGPPGGQSGVENCRCEESIPAVHRCAPKQDIAFRAQYRERDLTGQKG
jgi:hypothetical protein